MQMIGNYIKNRAELALLCVLIDASVGVKDIDLYVIDLLNTHDTPFMV